MDTPRIRYASSADGTAIAYAVFGEGPPLVLIDAFLSGGLDMRLESRHAAGFFALLGANRTVVAFDWRNSGLSGRAADFTAENLVGDLEAVANALGLESFDVWATQTSGQVALEFAARNPRRLRRLVFSQPRPKGMFDRPWSFGLSMIQAAGVDWNAFTELSGLRQYGWTEEGLEYVGELRKQWTPERLQAFLTTLNQLDPFARASSIECETLVLAREDDSPDNRRAALQLAAMLPNAQLIFTPLGDVRDPEQIRVAASFLGDFELPPRAAAGAAGEQLRAILFTDLVEHTRMMQRLGDAKGRVVLREHDRIVRNALRIHGGTEIKTTGDGFMASFGSAQQALECAIDLERAFEDFGRRDDLDLDPAEPLRIRVGINAGEPIVENDDLFGASVILAERTAAQAAGGEILVTDVVRQLAAGKGFVFADRGEIVPHGFEETVRLFEVRWQED